MDLRRGKFYERLTGDVVAWAEHEFELDRVVNGHSVRAQLEEAMKMSPSPTFESQLRNPVEFPAGVDYVYGWFMELCHTGRSYGQSGLALPLNSSEIWAWSQLNGVRLAPWELRLIRLLDVKWLNAFNKKST